MAVSRPAVVSGGSAPDGFEHRVVLQRSEVLDQQEECDQEAEVANTVGDEGLLAGVNGAGFQEPEADEQVRGQAYALPAHEHQQVAVGQNQHQHKKHEDVEVGEIAVVAALMLHVADGEDVDEEANTSDDQQHDQRKLVEPEAILNREAPRGHPGGVRLDMRDLRGGHSEELCCNPNGVSERRRGRTQRDGIDQRLGEALAQQAVDRGARQREQGNDLEVQVHSLRRFTRSTFNVSRVRKTAMMMARPTAASAAATTITKKTKMWPSSDLS